MKHHILGKTDHWDVTEPGFTEVDLVSHSGDRADGDFLHTLNLTDIQTTWVEHGAVMGKSQVRVQERLDHLRGGRPHKKNDNAHIEQKNWTHVRKLMGYVRYDSAGALAAMNDV